jgi:glycosyltransferase involved in cell wall biosynthesis
MKISLIQPSRNNLKYLKWSYDSIRKNQGDHEVQICVADDASSDGTLDWCKKTAKEDKLFKFIRNEGPDRLGHTILYDRLINEIATFDIAMIYHADMYLCPNALDYVEKLIEPKVIVSLTRIEPPLHPDGPEKVLLACGEEPERFREQAVLNYVFKNKDKDKVTEGIFAPWAFYRKDFQEIGGHDPLYAPQSKEDTDIFNRFQLNGVKFKQTWGGFVYHMTCRGSRRNVLDAAKNIHEDSPEWLAQNMRSTRNFIRKWGHFCLHDPLMKPIIPPKYNIRFNLTNTTIDKLHMLEPWCDNLDTDIPSEELDKYIKTEQKNTIIDLKPKFNYNKNSDITVNIDCNTFTNEDFINLSRMSQIIKDSGAAGEFNLGNLFINIVRVKEYTDNLIKLK